VRIRTIFVRMRTQSSASTYLQITETQHNIIMARILIIMKA